VQELVVPSQNPPFNLAQVLAVATAHHQSGQLAQAEQLYRQILQQQPQQTDALNLLGVIACQRGRLEEGVTLYRQALALRPGYLAARENLYLALWKQGKALLEEAIAGYTQIVTLQPDHLSAYENLGALLQEQGKLDEALSYYQQALGVKPDHPKILYATGAVLQQQGKVRLAMHYQQRALAVQPEYPEALLNLGLALLDQGKLEAATAMVDRAFQLSPDNPGIRYNRGVLWLIAGDYGRGFPEYEWRFQTGDFPPCPFTQPLWDGKPLNGKILLLHAEQGMGDTIQCIRYAAIARQRGARLVLTCHQPLMRLFSTLPGIEKMVPLGQPVPEFDTYAPLMSLPAIVGTTQETLPAEVPYLFPPTDSSLRLQAPDGTRLKVGIVWAGGHLYKKNQSRSCALQLFDPLLNLPEIAYYSLQKGFAQMELVDLGWQDRVQDLSDRLTDMAETAAAIAQLDLVITVDTSVAHLAGALGQPIWVLLSWMPDWRWMLERQDSPWYPTMRLFRQSQPDDWQGVITAVAAALQEKLQA